MQPLAPDLGHPVELRVLTGPNLYFPRPAVKLTLDAAGVLDAEPAAVVAWQRALRVRNPTVGLPHSPTRMQAAAELAAAVVRRAGGHAEHPGRRSRPGPGTTRPWWWPTRSGTAAPLSCSERQSPGRSPRSPRTGSTRSSPSARCRPRWPATIPVRRCGRCGRPSRSSR